MQPVELVPVKLEKIDKPALPDLREFGVDTKPARLPPISEEEIAYLNRDTAHAPHPVAFIALEPETLVGLVVSAAFLGAMGYDVLRTIVDRLREAFPFLSE